MNKKFQQKAFVLIAFMLVLSILIIIIITHKGNHKNKVCVKGFYSIDKVEIKQYGKTVVKLVKDHGYWTVNDLLPAKKDALLQMQHIIDNMRIIRKVDDHSLFDIRKQLLNSEPEVVLWRSGEVVNSFFIGGQPLDSVGNYFIPTDDLIVYIVQVPDIKVDLRSFFSTNPDYWRERYFLRHIARKSVYMFLLSPGQSAIKQKINKDTRKVLDSVLALDIIDNKGVIDSLEHSYKLGKYLCRIEFADENQLKRNSLTCFASNNNFLALLSDDGDNSIAILLSASDMKLLTSLIR